jgi:hypothetical protein
MDHNGYGKEVLLATANASTTTITFGIRPRIYRWWLGFKIDQQDRGIKLTDQKIGNEGLFGAMICWVRDQPPDVQNKIIDEGLAIYRQIGD